MFTLLRPVSMAVEKAGFHGGSPAVKKGDKVSAGDMLISSFMEGSFGVIRSVHAYGKVMASVNYEYVTEIPFEFEILSKISEEKANKVK